METMLSLGTERHRQEVRVPMEEWSSDLARQVIGIRYVQILQKRKAVKENRLQEK